MSNESSTGEIAAALLTHANGFDATGSTGTTSGSGIYTIIQNALNWATGYTGTIDFASANLTLSAKGLTVTASNESKNAGMSDPALLYTYSGLVGGEASGSFTGALSRGSGEAAGYYTITQGTLDATGNYTIGTFNNGTFTIDAVGPAFTLPSIVQRAGNQNVEGHLCRQRTLPARRSMLTATS